MPDVREAAADVVAAWDGTAGPAQAEWFPWLYDAVQKLRKALEAREGAVDLDAAAKALCALGVEAEAPDQSGYAEGFRDRLLLNIRGICVNEFSDWVTIELRHLDPEWAEVS
jgi:hypothetical protein